jgi:hypothetical protein
VSGDERAGVPAHDHVPTRLASGKALQFGYFTAVEPTLIDLDAISRRRGFPVLTLRVLQFNASHRCAAYAKYFTRFKWEAESSLSGIFGAR